MRGYTLTEMMLTLSVASIITAAAIPSIQGLRQEALEIKAKKEVQSIQAAVETFYKKTQTMPQNLNDLMNMDHPILGNNLNDPFATLNKEKYGYEVGQMGGQNYYVIYSKGIDGHVSFKVDKNRIEKSGDDIVVSNLPVFEEE
jgi:prepilin-type N-terminal cleavage/methylation domain-containing protein